MIHCDILSQNMTAILLQNPTEVYYKIRQVCYYKMRVLLQNATVIRNGDNFLQNPTFITKHDVYYKLRQYTDHQFSRKRYVVILA